MIFPERRNTMKASFENAKIDVILFANEDVITSSDNDGEELGFGDSEI